MSLMGDRIYQLRTEKGLTMEQLGELVGVQASAVNKWEKGTVEIIKRPTILKLAKVFGCSPAWLMGIDTEPQPQLPEYDARHLELIEMFSKLSSEQQEVIMNTMRAFLQSNHI